MKIAVMGAGGIGGYYGGMLAAAGQEVAFVARGAHLAALREGGLAVLGGRGDIQLPSVQASDDPAEIGPVDVVLFCVKLYDTETAAAALPPLIGPETMVISLQNGVDSCERLAREVSAARVLSGIAYVAAHIAEPGVIRYVSDMNSMVFGEADGARSARTSAFAEVGRDAGFEVAVSDDIDAALWGKFVLLATNAAMSALSRLNVHYLYRDAVLRALARDAMAEVVAVAAAKGIRLADDIMARSLALSDSYPPEMTTSMHNDLKRARPLELEHFSGLIARYGDELSVPTPIHRAAWAALKPFQAGGRSVDLL